MLRTLIGVGTPRELTGAWKRMIEQIAAWLAPPRPAIHRCNLGISLQNSDRFFREVSESVSSLDWQKEQRWPRVESLAARWYLDQGFQPLPREWSVYSVHLNDYLPSSGKAIHFAGGEQKHEMRNRLEKWG